jgi:predicted membrane chloride channel (bestrophin family)
MFKTEKLGLWGVIILTTIYLYVINLYFEYIINREVESEIQIVLGLVALSYTIFQIKLIVNKLSNLFKKEEKND